MADEVKTNTTANGEQENAQTGAETTIPTFDEILATKEYQSEFDRRIAKALDTAREKWETEAAGKIEEAKKTAKMTAEQKADYERKQTEAELARREAEITRRELRADAVEKLAEKNLPTSLADTLDYSDAETCAKSIQAVETAFRQAVEAAVNDRLRGESPKTGEEPATVTKEQFAAMSYTQRAELFENDRKLYDELVGGI